jgi:uncharacterized protein (TIGR02271 family)
MITQDQLRNVIGTTAYDRDGDKIGKVGQVYYDDDTDQPRWITVNTGFFGTNENFVPVQGAEMGSDRVTVAYDKATVKDAPNIAEDGHLTPEEEAALYRHYGLDYGTGAVGTVGDGRTDYDRTDRTDRTDRSADTVGYDTSGPTTDTAMTRSEEHLRVGTEVREAGRARLRKYIVTDRETAQVPVSREEVRVEREPITDANRGDAYDGPALSEEEHEVVLHAERPVVDTEVEAVERVRLDTETVRSTETVSGEVRKEEIEVIDETTTVRDRDLDRDR